MAAQAAIHDLAFLFEFCFPSRDKEISWMAACAAMTLLVV
jgi:hypothetical protein